MRAAVKSKNLMEEINSGNAEIHMREQNSGQVVNWMSRIPDAAKLFPVLRVSHLGARSVFLFAVGDSVICLNKIVPLRKPFAGL
jgi:hypothetical protein